MPSLVIHARYDRDDIAEKILPALAGFTIFFCICYPHEPHGSLKKAFYCFIAYFITVFNTYFINE